MLVAPTPTPSPSLAFAKMVLTTSGISHCSSTAPAAWIAAVTSSLMAHSSLVLAPPT